MATTIHNEPIHRADEDNVKRVITTPDARQGAVSGRVLTVLIVSVVALAVIFAIIWLTKG
jgi:hypothetical protein